MVEAQGLIADERVTNVISGSIYAGMMATLLVVGERVTHKQMRDGHSPSWGAILGQSVARKFTEAKDKIIHATYGGYIGEVIVEEIVYAIPALGTGLHFGLKAGAAVAAGEAIVGIVSNAIKHHRLKEASGEPILLKPLREKLKTKEHVSETFNTVFRRNLNATQNNIAA